MIWEQKWDVLDHPFNPKGFLIMSWSPWSKDQSLLSRGSGFVLPTISFWFFSLRKELYYLMVELNLQGFYETDPLVVTFNPHAFKNYVQLNMNSFILIFIWIMNKCTVICKNTDGPNGHHVNENEHIQWDYLTYMQNLHQSLICRIPAEWWKPDWQPKTDVGSVYPH